jgi:GNAT superfamily N-acetyltransferase
VSAEQEGPPPPFRFESLAEGQALPADFSCGDRDHERTLDAYARPGGQLESDLRRRACSAFVAIEQASGRVAGFCALTCCEIRRESLPAGMARKLPRYASVGGVLLGRMAVDRRFQRRGLGTLLTAEAFRRARQVSNLAGAALLVVDAMTPELVPFYEGLGFVAVGQAEEGRPRRLVLPLDAPGPEK